MKKLLLICLALVLAVGTMGVGYALWSDSLYIQGTIETGEIDFCIASVASDDVGLDPGYQKDVASTTVEILDCHHARVTVNNAYPCYENYVHFTVQFLGTVPVHLEEIRVTSSDPCIEVEAWDGLGEQRHPGERADNTLWFHVLQCADQNATYTFDVEFYYVQYNESIYPPQVP